jgi:hypothetical protein
MGKGLYRVKEVCLSFSIAVDDCLSGIGWKVLVLDDELVQVISQKVSTCVTSMPIKDAKKAALWPVFYVFF